MKTFRNHTKKMLTLAVCAVSLGYAANSFSDVNGLIEWDEPSPWTQAASACTVDESAVGKYAI